MEKCRREVLERSGREKCWSSQHRQEMPTHAQLFEYGLSPLLHIDCQVILACLQSSTISNSEKMDTKAQWFHSSWSILLKRVNIRVRGFHLVIRYDLLYTMI